MTFLGRLTRGGDPGAATASAVCDAAVLEWDPHGGVGETPSPLMTRSPRYEPGEGSRAHTQCP